MPSDYDIYNTAKLNSKLKPFSIPNPEHLTWEILQSIYQMLPALSLSIIML